MKRTTFSACLLVPLLVAAAESGAGAAPTAVRSADGPADLVFFNGNVLTMDASGTKAQAVATRRDRVVAVGTNAEVQSLAGRTTRMIDLQGRTLLPGFVDSRVEGAFGYWEVTSGVRLVDADGSPMARLEEIEAAVTSWCEAHKPAQGQWLVASGFDARLTASRKFDRALAERAAPGNPLVMLSFDHHAALLNGKAIDLLDLKGLARSVASGDVALDPAGEPTGLVREVPVFLLLNRLWAALPEAVRREATLQFLDAAARSGITTVGVPLAIPSDLTTAESLLRDGDLAARMVVSAFGPNEEARAALEAYGRDGRSPDPDRLSVGPPLYFLDGTPFAWRAALFQPYGDAPWTAGLLALSPEAIDSLVAGWAARREGAILDAAGSLAVHLLLEASGRTPAAAGGAPRPLLRADGLDVIAPYDRPRLGSLASSGLVVTFQPTRLPYRVYLEKALGSDRIEHAFSYRTVVDAGIPVALNSDWPMTSQTFQPTQVMEWAVTHTGWRTDQGLTVEQALRAYTAGAARALSMQDRIGTIEVGKKGDLVMVDGNPLDLAGSPEALSDLPVRMTVASGVIVFEDRKSVASASRRPVPAGAAATGPGRN